MQARQEPVMRITVAETGGNNCPKVEGKNWLLQSCCTHTRMHPDTTVKIEKMVPHAHSQSVSWLMRVYFTIGYGLFAVGGYYE